MKQDRTSWPFLVRLGLLWVPSRKIAWGYFWFSVVLAISFPICGFFVFPYILTRFEHAVLAGILGGIAGFLMLLAPIWYYLAIKWVDRNGTWS